MTAPVPHLPGFHLSSGLEYYRNNSVRVVSDPSAQSAMAQGDHKDVKQEWENLLADIQAQLAKGRSNSDPWVPELKLSKRYENCPKLRQRVKKAGGICLRLSLCLSRLWFRGMVREHQLVPSTAN